MSDFSVVAEVSNELRRVLWQEFQQDALIQSLVDSEADIVFTNPTETARQEANQLSIWLYQITENEFVKNQPMQRGDLPNQQRFPPLALNLYYLITPFAGGEGDLLILGKTMQAFYDNAILILRNVAMEVDEELRIVFCRLTLEELTRIWEALHEPYRLSVCYQVSVARIDSLRAPENGRVTQNDFRYGEKPFEVIR